MYDLFMHKRAIPTKGQTIITTRTNETAQVVSVTPEGAAFVHFVEEDTYCTLSPREYMIAREA